MYQSSYQIDGTKAHESVDNSTYSTRNNIITSLEVYSDKYKLTGKIYIYDAYKKLLVNEMRMFHLEEFHQTNALKCKKCIYEDACDRSLNGGE